VSTVMSASPISRSTNLATSFSSKLKPSARSSKSMNLSVPSKLLKPYLTCLGGEVLEFNEELTTKPETINQDPYSKGWVVKIRIQNSAEIAEMLTPAQYSEVIKS
jgi:glycine cleavage system H lipoate-binding protein